MRNLKFYGLLIIMLLSIFLLSGCGGSVRDSSESGSTDDQASTETPNSLPDTQNMAQLLKGTWIGINGSGTVQDSSANSYTWDIIQSAINFSNVKLSGNSGTATITSLFVCSVKNPSGVYIGTERIYREARSANMIRAGSDSWICEYNDKEGEKHVLTIDVTDKTSYSYIKITEKGEIENPEFDYVYYEMTANLRHSDSENDTIDPISDSNPPEVEEPVDFAKILDATWLGLDGTGTVQDSEANSYTWELARAAINFSGTKLTGNTGTTTITSLLIWSVKNPEGAYAGNEKIYRDSRPATMIKNGDYSWICEYSDSQGERHVMSIDVTDKDSYSYVKISEKGSLENPDFNYKYYEMSANLIRSDLSKSSIEEISDSVEPANIAKVLNATWLGLNGSGTVSDSDANSYTWDLSRALINFSNTSLGERTGTTILTTLYVWTVKDSDGAYIGNERIYRSSRPATMMRTAADSWVCEYDDSQGKHHVMSINITDDNSYSYISVTEKGEIENPDFAYNYYEITADFVRSDSGSETITPIDDKPDDS